MPTSIEAFLILLFLLPGFVGLIVYELIAEVPRREVLDRVVAALAFTVLANTIQYFVTDSSLLRHLGAPVDIVVVGWRMLVEELAWAALAASICALAVAIVRNRRWISQVASHLKMARRTGAIDVWHQVFSDVDGKWARVRYKDGTTLTGWPRFYSEDSKSMMLFLADAVWHFSTNGEPPSDDESGHRVIGAGVLIVNFTDIKGIEVLE